MTQPAEPRKQYAGRTLRGLLLAAGITASGAAAGQGENLFIIGQDIGTVRAYLASGCCPRPDGTTFYLFLYDFLDPAAGYGGLGMDATGRPLEGYHDSGSGLLHGWRAGREFPGGVAIGLAIIENHHPGALDQLVAGGHDAELAQLARFIRDLDRRVWLRIGYEFDGAWNQGYGDATRYKAAFRKVATYLREAGVENLEFVWQASTSPVDDVIDGRHEDIADWYPGDDVVDWVALSWFLGADEAPPVAPPGGPVATQRMLMDEVLALARAHGKRVMVAESAPQGYDLARGSNAHIATLWDGPAGEGRVAATADEVWAQWYAPLFAWLAANDDVVDAFAYINTNWDAQRRWGPPYGEGYWGDSRLEADPEIARRFGAALAAWRGR